MIQFKQLPVYGKIIYITVGVYILTQLWRLACLLFVVSGYHWQSVLALPANISVFLMHPWTLLTYMFCHADIGQNIFHIIFNMLWLWWFGKLFLLFHTQRQFLSLYLLGGVFSGLFFLLVYNIFPYFLLDRGTAIVVGASGALMAIMGAVALQPDQPVGVNLLFRTVTTSVQRLTFIIMALTLFAGSGGNTGGMVCHIGGMVFGLIYGYYFRQGKDITAFTGKWIDCINRWFSNLGKPRMQATRGGRKAPIDADKMRDMDYNADRRQREAEIDRILDKISKSGYDRLSAEEKQLLFDVSKKRGNQ